MTPSDPAPANFPVELQTLGEGRQRELCAQVVIPRSLEQVWGVLTDYECLAKFIPNLALSRRVAHPDGKIRLEQIGNQQFLKLNFAARVVLDMEEDYPHAINFAMVEGDFKVFKGAWKLSAVEVEGKACTRLTYCLTVIPKLAMPVKLIEGCLGRDLSNNLAAISQYVTDLYPASA